MGSEGNEIIRLLKNHFWFSRSEGVKIPFFRPSLKVCFIRTYSLLHGALVCHYSAVYDSELVAQLQNSKPITKYFMKTFERTIKTKMLHKDR